MTIQIETPQSIYDDTDPHEDVFSIALEHAGFSGTQEQNLNSALWDAYRYRMINSCSRDLWIQLLKDRARSLYGTYKPMLDLFDKSDMTDTIVSSFENVTETQSENLPDVPVEDTEYLSDRGKTVQRGSSQSGTMAQTYSDVFGAMTDPYRVFVNEFADLFLNRW